MAKSSKKEWEEVRREKEEKTDAAIKESDDVKTDAAQATQEWNQQEAPSLVETAQALSAIAKELGSDIQKTHGEKAEVVNEAIEEQAREISDLAHQDEETERSAGERLGGISRQEGGQFLERLSEAAEQRKEAEQFLKEIAEEDEAHQIKSKEMLKEHEQEVQDAIQKIEEFDA